MLKQLLYLEIADDKYDAEVLKVKFVTGIPKVSFTIVLPIQAKHIAELKINLRLGVLGLDTLFLCTVLHDSVYLYRIWSARVVQKSSRCVLPKRCSSTAQVRCGTTALNAKSSKRRLLSVRRCRSCWG